MPRGCREGHLLLFRVGRRNIWRIMPDIGMRGRVFLVKLLMLMHCKCYFDDMGGKSKTAVLSIPIYHALECAHQKLILKTMYFINLTEAGLTWKVVAFGVEEYY